MKIFGWMRTARNQAKESTTHGHGHKPCQPSTYTNDRDDEFSDWPNGLLAIGTFGNAHLPAADCKVVEPNERGASVLHEESEKSADSQDDKNERTACNGSDSSLVCSGGREIQKGRGMGKKSVSYLLKKAFVCNAGFAPNPIAKDLLPDPKSDTSRVDKILRAMLHKKIYPQRPSPKTTSQKYLDTPATNEEEIEHELQKKQETNHNPKIKWVKTDSEYIVLEI